MNEKMRRYNTAMEKFLEVNNEIIIMEVVEAIKRLKMGKQQSMTIL